VLELRNRVDDGVDVERVATQRVRRNLPVQDLGGDVGVIRRNLAPPLRSFVRAHANQCDLRVPEALDAGDPH
jgi:hypothetical protein